MLGTVALCLVVAISDGDTLKARCGESGAYELGAVRLAEIDAPEKAQAFGQRSRQNLARLCFGEVATIRVQTVDRYGRTVARVECHGKDASLDQAEKGLAWFYVRYGRDPAIRQAEQAARAGRLGLWADPEPVPPWEWRRGRR